MKQNQICKTIHDKMDTVVADIQVIDLRILDFSNWILFDVIRNEILIGLYHS